MGKQDKYSKQDFDMVNICLSIFGQQGKYSKQGRREQYLYKD